MTLKRCNTSFRASLWFTSFCMYCSIIGLPDENEWPSTVSLPRDSFPYSPQLSMEDIIPELAEQSGPDLLEVCSSISLNL